MSEFTKYFRLIGAPQAGNWVRYIPELSNDQVIVGLSVFLTSLSPRLNILTVPITGRSRTQYNRTIVGGSKIAGKWVSSPTEKRVPYKWSFEKTTAPEQITDKELLESFGRTYCELIFTDRFDTFLPELAKKSIRVQAERGVNHNINYEHWGFLHDELDQVSYNAFKKASMHYRLIHEST